MSDSDSRDEVAQLYAVAHAAKQKAKAMKARLDYIDERNAKAAEAARQKELRLQSEQKEEREKRELDERIRYGLLGMANTAKMRGVVFKGPGTSLALKRDLPTFRVVDVKTGKVVEVRVVANGFEWD